MMVNRIYTCVTSTLFSICLNRDLHWYFKGGRGLRQGDPISPYLFPLIMEVFTLILKNIIHQSQDFKYHAGCKEIGITHLCFADDLLVLCHRSVDSVRVIKDALDQFRSLQLITSVLGSMHVYWASVFLLPMSVVKDIEKVLKIFLWTQGDMARGKAKIAWKTIYIYDARFDQNATIADMVVDGQWLKDDADIVFWKCNNGNKNAFSVSQVWKDYGESLPKVTWGNLVCPDLPNKWDRLVNEMASRFKNRSIKSIVSKFAFGAAVYFIWHERNKRQFTGEKRNSADLLDVILETIRLRLTCIKVLNNLYVQKVSNEWNVNVLAGMVHSGADLSSRLDICVWPLQCLEPCILEFSLASGPFDFILVFPGFNSVCVVWRKVGSDEMSALSLLLLGMLRDEC
ncbi:RNA-directed DNA polymerase, eukaryota, reverse transcriptase zinc-binding domain protein [Tanacetum coccineum]